MAEHSGPFEGATENTTDGPCDFDGELVGRAEATLDGLELLVKLGGLDPVIDGEEEAKGVGLTLAVTEGTLEAI